MGTSPHPTGHPSKKAIFLLFVRVRNDATEAPGLAPLWNSQPSPNPPPSLELPSPLRPPQPSPATKALAPVGTPPPPHRASFKKRHFSSFFVRVRNNKNTTHVAKFAPSLGPVSLPPTPPEPKPLHPPPPLRCNLCVTALTTVQTARQSGVSFTAEALECY